MGLDEARPSALASLKMSSRSLCLASFLIAACVIATGCGGKKIKTAKPPRFGSTESGVASWYGHPYHGRRAANGEVYDMEKLTAAHRTLPFNTWVRVHNLSNDKTVEVRIQDRGPFIDNRIIDLSRAAAREIDMLSAGISKVRLTIIAPPKDAERQPELFAVQVGAFSDAARAESIRSQMSARFGSARLVQRSGTPVIWRVLVGEKESSAEAEALAAEIRSSGSDALVVRLDSVPPTAETP